MEHMKNKKNEPENKKAVKEKLKKEQIKEENESFENKEEQKSNKINTFLNKKTDFKVYELILFGTLIMIVSVFLTVVVMNDTSHNKNVLSNSSLKSDEKLAEFEEVYDLINTSYYKKVSKKKLIEGAINGMLDSLDDPHTSYFTKTEKENFDELMNGSYDGIGAEISLDKDGNVISVGRQNIGVVTVIEVYRKKHNIVDIITVLCYNIIIGDDNYDQQIRIKKRIL